MQEDHETLFMKNYIGLVEDEFKEDYLLYRTIKRTMNSFIKSPSTEKLHSIYNKIYCSTKQFTPEFIYEMSINDMETYESKQLIRYIIGTFFDINYNTSIIIDDDWISYLEELENKKLRSLEI